MSHNNRPPPRIDGMISLKVDNLTYRTTPEDLRRVFERCGEVGDIYIPRDRFTRESRGFAFVRFYDKRDAEDALEAMDGRVLDGRELRVQMARYGRPTSPHRRSGSGRGGGGGRRRRSRSPRRRSRSPRRRNASFSPRSRSRSFGSRSPTRRGKFSRSRSPVARKSFSRSNSRNGRSVSRSPSRSRS
ncbi:serine/arginine-rich splicing factor 2 [Hermetia illucens]|uniref:serine/arginine-rich splicing factor 2 n=1 Tax=Hermetia illucens TaxID=343691 RepID=UPI0018CC44C7|nr:serine/arginine-rich splicing factor 2 [Hermetia illucens]